MAYEEYKVLLLAKQQELLERENLAEHDAQGEAGDRVRDWSDESVADEDSGLSLKEADQDATLLQQVQAALQRIENGSYGKCQVDGRPIEEKRIKQIPWVVYCLKHQRELEESSPPPATL
jgi:RNA polymerase-binding transcription factor DksA